MPLLIISDIRMPKVDGHELMTKLRDSQDLRLRSIPYVFVTAAVPEEVLVDAYANSRKVFL
jgi:CheY-like chemotaxis protein